MAEPALIIYDGDCIFCQNYVKLVRLRETVGNMDLVDARSDDPRVAQYQRLGYDLNEGMLFVWQEKIYHGSDAVHILGKLSSPVTLFNKINSKIFSIRILSTMIYPFLKIGRKATLFIRGKGPIKSA